MKTLLDIMRKGRMKREPLKYDSKYVPGDDAMWRMKDGSNVGEKKNRGIVGNPDELAKKVQHKGKGEVSSARNKSSEVKDKPKEESKPESKPEAKKEPSQPKEAKGPDSSKETASKIMEAAQKENVVDLADLRDSFPPEMSKEEFDKAVIGLAEQGKIIVYRDANPESFTEEQLGKFVKDGDNYYTSIAAPVGSKGGASSTPKMPPNPDDMASSVGKPEKKPKASSIMDKMRSKPKDAAPKEQPKEEPRPEAKAPEAPAEAKKQTIPQQQANEIVTEALQNGTASSWIRHAINSSVRGGKGVDPDELESDANLALMEVASSLTPEEAADPSIFRKKAKAAITNAIIDSFRRKNTVKAGVGKKKQMGEEFDAADKKTEAPNADKVDADKVRAFVQSLDSPVLQQIAEGKMNKVPIRKIAEELEISPGTAQRLWEKIVEKAGGKEDKFYKQKEAEGKERYGYPVRDDVWEEILKQSKQYPFPGEFVRCVMAAMEKSQGQWDAINAGRKAYMSGERYAKGDSPYVPGDNANWKMKDGSNVGDAKNQGVSGSPDDMSSSVGKGDKKTGDVKSRNEPWENAVQAARDGDVSGAMKHFEGLSKDDLFKQANNLGVFGKTRKDVLSRVETALQGQTPESRTARDKESTQRSDYLSAKHLLNTVEEGTYSPNASSVAMDKLGLTYSEFRERIDSGDKEVISEVKKAAMSELADAVKKLDAENKDHAEIIEQAKKHLAGDEEPKSVRDDFVESVKQAQSTDKKFNGGGRYESEVWMKLRAKHPNEPMPKLSRQGAEYVADEYESDGKEVPYEVFDGHPDLAGKYKVSANRYEKEEEEPKHAPRHQAPKRLDGAVARLEALLEYREEIDEEALEDEVRGIAREFDAADLKEIARKFGVKKGLATKLAALEKILAKVCGD